MARRIAAPRSQRRFEYHVSLLPAGLRNAHIDVCNHTSLAGGRLVCQRFLGILTVRGIPLHYDPEDFPVLAAAR
jgi:hypothetical protein